MDAEVKRRWVEALRSGEYEQGQGQLRADGKFCCLGVLCDLVQPEAWTVSVLGGQFMHRDLITMPDPTLQSLVGLEEEASELSALNDDGWTFEEIAQLIEETL